MHKFTVTHEKEGDWFPFTQTRINMGAGAANIELLSGAKY